MPRGDRTGPDGMGSMTGRGLGFCNGFNSPGFTRGNPRGGAGYGRGYGRMSGRGFQRGNGWGYNNYPAHPYRMGKNEETQVIEDRIDVLKDELKSLEARLDDLKEEK